jgi:hypothetical protein
MKEYSLYADHENLATALVPSEIACLANSPGRISLTADWTYREERVLFLLNLMSLEPSLAALSKIS